VDRVPRTHGHLRREQEVREGSTGRQLTIKVKGSQLRVCFIAGFREGETVEAQIAMDERTRNTGRGQYEHIAPPIKTRAHSRQLWGFWEIQIKAGSPQTILVHTTYAREDEIAPAF
jgi:hypothetical protein